MGWHGIGFIGPAPLVILSLLKLGVAIRNKCTKGVFVDRNHSNIVDPQGKLIKKNLIPVFGNWQGNIAQVFLFTFAYKFAKLGGVN
mmetsp:Transcript_17589/g.29697  ORF Transcript_17589/g.29697 Transcript_17589/m.29697 type:complete len:86 (+) Transcript_17589:326-583(+)